MEFIAPLPGKSRPCRILAVALFFSCLALQPAFSELGSVAAENAQAATPHKVKSSKISTRPFAHVAIGVNAGTLGPGIEAVTTLTRKSNLRVDGGFFDYGLSLAQSGVQYNGTLNLRSARATYDFYPFGGGFRISAGAALYNKFNLGANAMVAGGNKITLNDTDYYSSSTNPMTGTASLLYGRKVAPTVTFGWGNAIPRSGRHWSIPVEFGAAFTGTPTVNLNFAGSACTTSAQTPGTCGDVSTIDGFQSNLAAQRQKIVSDISPLRVYPILNVGFAYRF